MKRMTIGYLWIWSSRIWNNLTCVPFSFTMNQWSWLLASDFAQYKARFHTGQNCLGFRKRNAKCSLPCKMWNTRTVATIQIKKFFRFGTNYGEFAELVTEGRYHLKYYKTACVCYLIFHNKNKQISLLNSQRIITGELCKVFKYVEEFKYFSWQEQASLKQHLKALFQKEETGWPQWEGISQ